MLYALLTPFRDAVGALNVFQYITFRAAGAAITALVVVWLSGRHVIAWLQRQQFGQTVRSDGPQTHLKKQGTPTMGGLMMLGGALLATLLWARLDNRFVYYALAVMLGYGALGFADDWIKSRRKNVGGVPARAKLVVQCAVAAIVVALVLLDPDYSTRFYVPFLKHPIADFGVAFYLPFAVFLIVGSSNAVNLTDGLDGLATGITLVVLATYAVFAYVSGHIDFAKYLHVPYSPQAGELTVLIAALGGAAMGFLWYNAHPAEVFMGDVGSLALGGVMATVALLVKQEVLLALVGGVFVAETLSVLIQVGIYKRTKKRVFRMAPLHHHFELLGWPETKVVIRFWIVAIVLGIAGLATLKLR